MKVLRRLMYRDIFSAVAFVTLAFLALFFFFDLLEELRWVNRIGNTNYKLIHALVSVSLSMPQHLYELLPITVLIGTIFVMARLAQTSEFTIMRTSGLGPWRALGTLLSIGVAFVVLTFAVGDYAAPAAEKIAQKLRAEQLGQLPTGASGAWLKERQGDHSIAINIRTIKSPGEFSNVRIFDFDADGRISAQINAEWPMSMMTKTSGCCAVSKAVTCSKTVSAPCSSARTVKRWSGPPASAQPWWLQP